jgi:hypothetical protein
MGTKGLAWRASARWTLDTGWKPLEAYATLSGARSSWLPDWTPLQVMNCPNSQIAGFLGGLVGGVHRVVVGLSPDAKDAIGF